MITAADAFDSLPAVGTWLDQHAGPHPGAWGPQGSPAEQLHRALAESMEARSD